MKLVLLMLLFVATNTVAQNKPVDTANAGANKKADSITVQKTDTIPYASLYFYRPYIPIMKASVNKVYIYINDSLVYKLKANTIISMKVWKQGKYIIAVDKKGETDIPVTIKFGKEYFFECEPKKGLVFGSPTIDLVTPAAGKVASGMLKGD